MVQSLIGMTRGQVKAEIAAMSAQWPIHEPRPGDDTAFVMNAVTQNAALIVRFRLAEPMTVNGLACGIGSANGNIDQGLFLPDSDFDPLEALGRTGSTAASGANAVQVGNLSSGIPLDAGIDYCYVFATDSASLTIYRISQALTNLTGYNKKLLSKASVWSTGLPSSIATPTNGQYRPWFALVP